MTAKATETNATQPDFVRERLDDLMSRIKRAAATQVGYPGNQVFDFSEILPFLDYSLNNVGDPFHDSNYWSNTHEFEREVIEHFARLTNLPMERAWGYVTSGGTEGNMYGLYLARELYPDGIVYFSEETHYSVLKNVRVLNVNYSMVKRQPDGEVDYQELQEIINVNRRRPAIVMANIGTTMRGAVDSLPRIRAILEEAQVEHSYIHADAALSGVILPFVEEPQPFGFDAGIDSISVSGHKLIGVLVAGMLDTADYAVRQFNRNGIKAWRHLNSATVVFTRPSASVFEKWQIAPEGDEAHIITMPHVTRDMIDELVQDCIG